MFRFLLLALMLAYVCAQIHTPYHSCVDPDPIIYLNVNDCTSKRCEVKRGETVRVKEQFKAPFNSATMVAYSVAYVSGINVLLDSHNDCLNLIFPDTCPLIKDHLYTFAYIIVVPPTSPVGDATVKVTRMGDNGQVITCVDIDLKVV